MADREYRLAIVIDAINKASGVLEGLGSNVQSLGKAAIGLGGAAVAGVGAMGAALGKLAVDAAPLEGIEEAFVGIAESSGRSADEMLAALTKGSAGMVAQRDLMKTYNQAAQLVGTTFANQLPDAMEYLGKVSAATGEDMGYLLESLTRGVGRLSPMILDNLAIQVDLTAANEAYAAQMGKTVSELSKGEQQAALMAQVLEKLAENTAAMPEVTGSAAQQLAELGAKFQNLKDDIGMAVLPVLNQVAERLLQLADRWLPVVVSFIESNVMPVLDKFVWALGALAGSLTTSGICLGSVQDVLWEFLPAETIDRIMGFIEAIGELIGAVQPHIEQIVSWIGEHVKLQDVLIALGIAIASVVVPAIVSLIASVAPVIAVGAALVAVVALVRTAWEENWLGIQEIVGAVGSFITEVIWPAIQEALGFLTDVVLPAAQAAFEALWSRAQEAWSSFWGAFQPALERMHGKLQEFYAEIKPRLEEAWNKLQELWDAAVRMWTEHLQPALDRLAEALGLSGDETSEWAEKLGTLVGVLLEAGLEALLNSIVAAIDAFVLAVTAVTAAMEAWNSVIASIKSSLAGMELPAWLTPGSPTPLQLGIEGINEALGEMGRLLPNLQMEGMLGLALGGQGRMVGERVVVLAPIFLDPREYVMAGGEIDYERVGVRLRELQEGI